MIKIAICSKDDFIRKTIQNNIEEIGDEYGITDINIDVYYSSIELLNHLKNKIFYNIVFVDTKEELEKEVRVINQINILDKNAIVMCIVPRSYYHTLLDSESIFRIIYTPINFEIFKFCFLQAYEKSMVSYMFFEYKYRKITYKVPLFDIMYFESKKRTIYIVLNHDIAFDIPLCFTGKMNDIEVMFQNNMDFWRIHQSYLVNKRFILKNSYDILQLSNGDILPISEERRKYMNDPLTSAEKSYAVY